MISILANLVIVCCLLAVVFWIINYLKIWEKIPEILQRVIVCLVVLFVVLWLITLFKDGGSSRYMIWRL